MSLSTCSNDDFQAKILTITKVITPSEVEVMEGKTS